jgi:ABC-2 type transport system ATP-binding protein
MGAQAQPTLVCRGLRRRFGAIEAVRDVSFTVAPGETYGLLGPNGAGKTTTISIVCGLLRADEGSVEIEGHELTTHDVAPRKLIGYVPQELALYPDLSGRENVRLFGRLYGLSRQEAARRGDEALELVGLADRGRDRADTYSGGMQRRLNIALGLLHRPRLLVLDEPTVGVDPQSRNAILESVDALGREGMAVLYTTHYMEEAERLCDRIGILDAGELKAEGTRRELISLVGEHDRVRLAGGGDLHAAAVALAAVAGVERAEVTDDAVELVVADARQLLPELLRRATESGARPDAVEVREPNLETVFLHLTGRALRD